VTTRGEGEPSGEAERDSRRLEERLLSPRPFLHEVAAALYVAGGVALLETLPVSYPRAAILLAGSLPMAWFAGATLVLLLAREALRRRAGRPAPFPPRAEAILLLRAAAVLLPVLSVHFLLKSFVWLVHPRTFDGLLWEVDRALHLGVSPTLFATAAFADPALLRVLDVLYSGGYFALAVVAVPVLLVLPRPELRMAFVASFAAIWMAGSVLYLAFPSWGPVFVVPQLFAEVLPHMPATVSVQRVIFGELSSLVNDPQAARTVRYGSVAAFPSLHLAVVTLLSVASRHVSRLWSRANAAFVAAMLAGSVVTGYHYLVDGWAGVLLALLAWGVARRLFPGTGGEGAAQRP